jgi:post-segregation antitoxin (ccd killing protein)
MCRQIIYASDELVHEARAQGLENLSEFVRESLKEYIAVRKALLGQIDSENRDGTLSSIKGAT